MGRMQEKGLTAFWEFLLKNVEKSLFSLTVFANLKCRWVSNTLRKFSQIVIHEKYSEPFLK